MLDVEIAGRAIVTADVGDDLRERADQVAVTSGAGPEPRHVVDAVRPRVARGEAQPFGEPAIEAQLQRVVTGTAMRGVVLNGRHPWSDASERPRVRNRSAAGQRAIE